MCNHVFRFPDDLPENYIKGGKLTGICKCGATLNAYGLRWSIPMADKFRREVPFGVKK